MLIRYRMLLSRIVIVIFAGYVLLYHPPDYLSPFFANLLELIGLVLLAVAAFGRIWCLVYSGGHKNKTLITHGPYSIVRNPLYVFSFIGAVGLGAAVENPLLALMFAVVFMVYYYFVVRNEERQLLEIFGSEYRDYCSVTPRWLPSFQLYNEPETITAYPVKIRNGILDAMWFIWAYLLWEILETLRSAGLWP